jgi:hypothetical protein
MSFSPFLYKIGEQEGGTGLAWWGWYQWNEGGRGEMVQQGVYGTSTIYKCK